MTLPEGILAATGTVLPEAGDSVLSAEQASMQIAENVGLNLSAADTAEDEDSDEIDLSAEEPIAATSGSEGLDFNAQKEAFEKEFIIKALKTFKGRINQTALHANIPKKTLLRKIEKYGINAKDFAN